MKIQSTRFGELNIAECDVIHFSQGLPGFPENIILPCCRKGKKVRFSFCNLRRIQT